MAVTAAVSAVDLYRFFHIGGTEVRALRGASLNRGRAEHIGGLTRSTRRRRVGRIPGGMEVLFDYANPLEEARVRATITAVSMPLDTGGAASTHPALGCGEIEDLNRAALAARSRQGMAAMSCGWGLGRGPSPTLGAAPDGGNTAGRSRR